MVIYQPNMAFCIFYALIACLPVPHKGPRSGAISYNIKMMMTISLKTDGNEKRRIFESRVRAHFLKAELFACFIYAISLDFIAAPY